MAVGIMWLVVGALLPYILLSEYVVAALQVTPQGAAWLYGGVVVTPEVITVPNGESRGMVTVAGNEKFSTAVVPREHAARAWFGMNRIVHSRRGISANARWRAIRNRCRGNCFIEFSSVPDITDRRRRCRLVV